MSDLHEQAAGFVGDLHNFFRDSFHADIDSGAVSNDDGTEVKRLKTWDEIDQARRDFLTDTVVDAYASAVSFCGGYEVGDDSEFVPPNPLQMLLDAMGGEDDDFLSEDEGKGIEL